MAQCGACTVIMRGQIMRSCVMPVGAVGQDEVTTQQGLARLKSLTRFSERLLRKEPPNAGFASAA
jgi:aerobic-type carbon monoxide dehydrogenase small subunit (CoxS/CutS family)